MLATIITQMALWDPVTSRENSFKVMTNSQYKQLLKQDGAHGSLDISNPG